jgi:hypothetical protein
MAKPIVAIHSLFFIEASLVEAMPSRTLDPCCNGSYLTRHLNALCPSTQPFAPNQLRFRSITSSVLVSVSLGTVIFVRS